MKYITLLIICTLCLYSQSKIDSLEQVVKVNDTNIEAKFQLAKLYHNEIANETGDEADRAEELFKSILEKKRDHVEARAYYGSLLTLKGRDAFLPWKKLSYVEDGCDEMDKAIKIAPENIDIRILRGLNNINLPGFFNRISYCLEDFEFIRNHPAFKSFSPKFQQQILFNNAKAFMNNSEEEKGVKLYNELIAIDSSSKFASKAKEIISE